MNLQKTMKKLLAGVIFGAALCLSNGVLPASISPTVIAEAASEVQWSVDAEQGKIYLKQGDAPYPTGWVYLNGNVTVDGVTITKGFYGINNGTVIMKYSKKGGAALTAPLSADGTLDAKKKYVLTFGTVTIADGKVTSTAKAYSGYYNGAYYAGGVLYKSGLVYHGGKFYKTTSAGKRGSLYTGVYTGSYVHCTLGKASKLSNVYISKGSYATGVVNRKYYVKGVFQSTFTGWKVVNKKRYYFTKGVAPSKQFKLLKTYTGDKYKYKYYFNADGTVSTNLFQDYGYEKCIKWLDSDKSVKQTVKIVVNLKSHNLSIFLYDKSTKKFDIPALTTVCSTSRKKNGTPIGHWRLEKSYTRRWVKVENSTPNRVYQWAVHILGTPTLFHSCAYAKWGNAKSLYTRYYNGLGTSQTSYCIRQQAAYAKIVYDYATKTNKKKRVMVDIGRGNNKGPFGIVKLKDTTGKLKGTFTSDPTDPTVHPNNKWWKKS